MPPDDPDDDSGEILLRQSRLESIQEQLTELTTEELRQLYRAVGARLGSAVSNQISLSVAVLTDTLLRVTNQLQAAQVILEDPLMFPETAPTPSSEEPDPVVVGEALPGLADSIWEQLRQGNGMQLDRIYSTFVESEQSINDALRHLLSEGRIGLTSGIYYARDEVRAEGDSGLLMSPDDHRRWVRDEVRALGGRAHLDVLLARRTAPYNDQAIRDAVETLLWSGHLIRLGEGIAETSRISVDEWVMGQLGPTCHSLGQLRQLRPQHYDADAIRLAVERLIAAGLVYYDANMRLIPMMSALRRADAVLAFLSGRESLTFQQIVDEGPWADWELQNYLRDLISEGRVVTSPQQQGIVYGVAGRAESPLLSALDQVLDDDT